MAQVAGKGSGDGSDHIANADLPEDRLVFVPSPQPAKKGEGASGTSSEPCAVSCSLWIGPDRDHVVFDGLTANEMFLNDPVEDFRGALPIPDPVGHDCCDRSPLADATTSDSESQHPSALRQSKLFEPMFEEFPGGGHLLGAGTAGFPSVDANQDGPQVVREMEFLGSVAGLLETSIDHNASSWRFSPK